jgi:hypothetical protein
MEEKETHLLDSRTEFINSASLLTQKQCQGMRLNKNKIHI